MTSAERARNKELEKMISDFVEIYGQYKAMNGKKGRSYEQDAVINA